MNGFLSILFGSLSVLSAAHVVIFYAAMKHHGKNADLVYDDYDRYILRKALPPWYVRYSAWVLHRPIDPTTWVLDRPEPR